MLPRRLGLLILSIFAIFSLFIVGPFRIALKPTRYTWKVFEIDMDPVPCAFCPIAKTYPYSSEDPIPIEPNPELLHPQCHLILSTEKVMAFLDIMPLTEGHVLVTSRDHREKLYDLKPNEGAAIGSWLPLISRATMRALGRPEGDWNIVQNNGASASQVVPHVHYHIIPRASDVPEIKARSWKIFGKGQRDDLDDDEGAALASKIRNELRAIVEAMKTSDPAEAKLLSRL